MTYFKNVGTIEELRKQFRDLLKVNHPDNGGDVAKMQEINAEYDKLFKILKDRHESKATGSDHEKTSFDNMKYDFSADQKLREVLQQIISFDGIAINVVGCYMLNTILNEIGRMKERINSMRSAVTIRGSGGYFLLSLSI